MNVTCCGQESYNGHERPKNDRRLKLIDNIKRFIGDIEQEERGRCRVSRSAGPSGPAGMRNMDEECREYRKRRDCTPPTITAISVHETRPTSNYSEAQHENNRQLTYVDASSPESSTPMPPAPWELPRTPSQELRAGTLYVNCECLKRNGLQHDCPRWNCSGRPECVAKNPGPCCDTSKARKPVRGDRRGRGGVGWTTGDVCNPRNACTTNGTGADSCLIGRTNETRTPTVNGPNGDLWSPNNPGRPIITGTQNAPGDEMIGMIAIVPIPAQQGVYQVFPQGLSTQVVPGYPAEACTPGPPQRPVEPQPPKDPRVYLPYSREQHQPPMRHQPPNDPCVYLPYSQEQHQPPMRHQPPNDPCVYLPNQQQQQPHNTQMECFCTPTAPSSNCQADYKRCYN